MTRRYKKPPYMKYLEELVLEGGAEITHRRAIRLQAPFLIQLFGNNRITRWFSRALLDSNDELLDYNERQEWLSAGPMYDEHTVRENPYDNRFSLEEQIEKDLRSRFDELSAVLGSLGSHLEQSGVEKSIEPVTVQTLQISMKQLPQLLMSKMPTLPINDRVHALHEIYKLIHTFFKYRSHEIFTQNIIDQIAQSLQLTALLFHESENASYLIPTATLDIRRWGEEFVYVDSSRLAITPETKVYHFRSKILQTNFGFRLCLFNAQLPPRESNGEILFDYDSVYMTEDHFAGDRLLGRPVKVVATMPHTKYSPPWIDSREYVQNLRGITNESSLDDLARYFASITSPLSGPDVTIKEDRITMSEAEVSMASSIVSRIESPIGFCYLAPARVLLELEKNGLTGGKIVNIWLDHKHPMNTKAGVIESFAGHMIVVHKGRAFDPLAYEQGLPVVEYLQKTFSTTQLRLQVQGFARGNIV